VGDEASGSLGRERVRSPPFVGSVWGVPLVDVPIVSKRVSGQKPGRQQCREPDSPLWVVDGFKDTSLSASAPIRSNVETTDLWLTVNHSLHLDDHAAVLFIEPVTLGRLDRDRSVLSAARVDCGGGLD